MMLFEEIKWKPPGKLCPVNLSISQQAHVVLLRALFRASVFNAGCKQSLKSVCPRVSQPRVLEHKGVSKKFQGVGKKFQGMKIIA